MTESLVAGALKALRRKTTESRDGLDFKAARRRLASHTSVLSGLSEKDRKAVLNCDDVEVSGSLARRKG